VRPRPLTKEEIAALRIAMPPVESEEWYELIGAAWNDVDQNAVCLDCGRKFRNLRGLRGHLSRSYRCRPGRDFVLQRYFLAKRLGVIEE